MKETQCRRCGIELWLRDEDAGSVKEELRMCDKCIEIDSRRLKALQDVEDSYNNHRSKFYRDNERLSWAVETINKRYEDKFNPLRS